MTSGLTLQLDDRDPNVDAEAFLEVFRDSLTLLQAMDKSLAVHGSETIRWRIANASKNSPLTATLVGDAKSREVLTHSANVSKICVLGIAGLSRSSEVPQHFNEETLRLVTRFGRVRAKGITGVRFSYDNVVVDVTRDVTRNAHKAIQRLQVQSSSLRDFGTVEGTLTTVTSKQGTQFHVVDSLTGQSITCYFSSEEIENKVRTAWKGRVCVSGELRMDKLTGDITSVQVHDVEPIQTEPTDWDALPKVDFTGGVESSEYIRNLRDDSYS